MNSSRKIMRQNEQEEETKKGKKSNAAVSEKKAKAPGFFAGRELKPILLTVLCAVIVLVLCIGVGIQQLKPKVVVTVGDTKLTLSDMMYPIYEVESTYLPYNEMYETYMGTTVWEADYSGSDESLSGVTNSVGFKQEILNSEVQYEVLYQLALENSYSLTDEEKQEAADDAEEALTGLSFFQKLRLDISKKSLTALFEKRALADKYQDDKCEELNEDVDEDAAIADISAEDYRQYDIQYYYVSLTTTDDDGNAVERSEDELADLKEQMEAIAELGADVDFTTLLDDDEDSEITLEEDGSFTEQDGWSYVTTKQLKQIKKMANGEVSDVFEGDSYYVVVKMIDNDSTEAYDTACDEAIEEAQDEAYQTWYDEISEEIGVTVNTDVWSDITIGYVTTDIVTAEDLERMSEEASSDVTSE